MSGWRTVTRLRAGERKAGKITYNRRVWRQPFELEGTDEAAGMVGERPPAQKD